jgi:hypothetical protein
MVQTVAVRLVGLVALASSLSGCAATKPPTIAGTWDLGGGYSIDVQPTWLGFLVWQRGYSEPGQPIERAERVEFDPARNLYWFPGIPGRHPTVLQLRRSGQDVEYAFNSEISPGQWLYGVWQHARRVPESQPAIDVEVLGNALPAWSSSGDGRTHPDYRALGSLARRIAELSDEERRRLVIRYSLRYCQSFDFDDACLKMYLLLRVLFGVPRSVPREQARQFSGVIHSASASGPAIDLSWPVSVDPSTGEATIAPCEGIVGSGYYPVLEHDYFAANFPRRSLAALTRLKWR